MCALLRRLGFRTHLLPVLLTRARAAELRAARRGHDRFSDAVIGWQIGSDGAPVPDYATAVAKGVLKVLDERPRAQVELVGDQSPLPQQLLGHRRVVQLSSRPGPETLARWAVHVWTPSLFDGDIADDTRSVAEAGAVGVATVLPEPAQSSIGGYPPPGRLVAGFHRAEDWIVALRALLDNEATRSRLSQAAMRRFDTMLGASASAAIVNRFIGWALYEGTSQ
jgi:glycosyltransferase involved in cell wall biosynthesis